MKPEHNQKMMYAALGIAAGCFLVLLFSISFVKQAAAPTIQEKQPALMEMARPSKDIIPPPDIQSAEEFTAAISVSEEVTEPVAEELEPEDIEIALEENEQKNQLAGGFIPSPEQSATTIVPQPKRTFQEDELHIGYITDMHVRSSTDKKKKKRAISKKFQEKIDHFTADMAQQFRPDAVIVGGDVIEGGYSSKIGTQELKTCRSWINATGIPTYWQIGNHDLRSVTKQQWKKALGIDYLDTAFTWGDYKVIIIDSNYGLADQDIKPGKYLTRGKVSVKQLEWLEKELQSTDKTKLVFIHHPPLVDVPNRNPGTGLFNATELQALFEKYKVEAVFSGHVEQLDHEKIGSVHYFVLPGILKHEKYQGAYSSISLEKGKVSVMLTYLDNKGVYHTTEVY